MASAKNIMTITSQDSYISYLPLPHIYEHMIYWMFIAHGAKVGIYSGDVKKLTNDMKVLKPTVFPSVPRLLNKVFDKIDQKIKNESGLKKWMV